MGTKQLLKNSVAVIPAILSNLPLAGSRYQRKAGSPQSTSRDGEDSTWRLDMGAAECD